MSKTFTAQESEELLSSLRRLVSAEPRELAPEPPKSLLLSLGASQEPKERISLISSEPEIATEPDTSEDRPLVLTPALRVVEELEPLPLLLSRFSNGAAAVAPVQADPVEEQPAASLAAFVAALEAAPATVPEAAQEAEEAPFIALSDESELTVELAEPEAEEAEAEEPETEEELAGHWSEQSLPDVAWIAEASGEWDDEESMAFASHLPAEEEPEEAPDLEWAASAEAEVHAPLTQSRPAAQGEVVEPHAVTSYAPSAMPMLDEDALREIVRQIIREELSGALGERITRNVRKLVRVEINRAMTTSSLE